MRKKQNINNTCKETFPVVRCLKIVTFWNVSRSSERTSQFTGWEPLSCGANRRARCKPAWILIVLTYSIRFCSCFLSMPCLWQSVELFSLIIKTRWRHNADFRSKACTHKNCPKLNVSHQIRPSSFLVRSGKNVFYAMFSACTWTPSLYFCSSCIGMRTWFVHRDTSHWLWGQIMRLVTYRGVCWPTVRKSWEMTVNPDVNTKTRNNRKTHKNNHLL